MSSENRQFLRVPLSDSSRAALVRFDGQNTLACELLNTSSGGFGVVVPKSQAATFPPGRILILESNGLLIQVKVAHGVADEERFLVGLERLADFDDEAIAKQEQTSWLTALQSPLGQRPEGHSTLIRDLVMAVVLAGGLLACFFIPSMLAQRQGIKRNVAKPPVGSWNSTATRRSAAARD